MDPIVISDRIQEFAGQRFYLCGRYFQRRGVRLHREVWSKANGPVPRGFAVHHADGNRSNNALANLTLMSKSAHQSLHSREKPPEDTKKWVRAMHEGARKWHKSPEGLAWHAQQGKIVSAAMAVLHRKTESKRCENCGQKYAVSEVMYARSKFCGLNCKMAALRRRRRAA